MTAELILSLQKAVDFFDSACEQLESPDDYDVLILDTYFKRCFELALAVMQNTPKESPEVIINHAYSKHLISDRELWFTMSKAHSSSLSTVTASNQYLAEFKYLIKRIDPTG